MNYVKEAIEDLRNYEPRKIAILNLKDKIKVLEERADGLNGGNVSGNAIKGGGNTHEETLINNIAAREKLALNLKIISSLVSQIDRAMEALNEDEKMVLEGFYIHRTSDYRYRLCDKLHVEETTLYRMKDAAIRKFTIAMYGIKDI